MLNSASHNQLFNTEQAVMSFTKWQKFIVFLLLVSILNKAAAGDQGGTGGKKKVLITHPNIQEKALNMLRNKGYELKISQNAQGSNSPSREILLQDIKGMDAVMWFGHVHVDQEMIDTAGPQLRVIGSMGAGYDHINVDLLYKKKIDVSNTPNILSSAVADMAIGLALAVSRNIIKGAQAVKKGEWVANHPSWMCGPTFEEATVGVIGLGAIGSKIVQRVKAFDVREVLYFNRHKKPADVENGAIFTDLDDLLKKSDFVFLAVPSNKDSKNLIAKERFAKMKNTAILINSARGDVVNQKDLVTAIRDGQIGGAGLDVTEKEPLDKNDELLTFDNVVVTPHISSATHFAREKMAVMAAQNIISVLEGGEPENPIPKPIENK